MWQRNSFPEGHREPLGHEHWPRAQVEDTVPRQTAKGSSLKTEEEQQGKIRSLHHQRGRQGRWVPAHKAKQMCMATAKVSRRLIIF